MRGLSQFQICARHDVTTGCLSKSCSTLSYPWGSTGSVPWRQCAPFDNPSWPRLNACDYVVEHSKGVRRVRGPVMPFVLFECGLCETLTRTWPMQTCSRERALSGKRSAEGSAIEETYISIFRLIGGIWHHMFFEPCAESMPGRNRWGLAVTFDPLSPKVRL